MSFKKDNWNCKKEEFLLLREEAFLKYALGAERVMWAQEVE